MPCLKASNPKPCELLLTHSHTSCKWWWKESHQGMNLWPRTCRSGGPHRQVGSGHFFNNTASWLFGVLHYPPNFVISHNGSATVNFRHSKIGTTQWAECYTPPVAWICYTHCSNIRLKTGYIPFLFVLKRKDAAEDIVCCKSPSKVRSARITAKKNNLALLVSWEESLHNTIS